MKPKKKSSQEEKPEKLEHSRVSSDSVVETKPKKKIWQRRLTFLPFTIASKKKSYKEEINRLREDLESKKKELKEIEQRFRKKEEEGSLCPWRDFSKTNIQIKEEIRQIKQQLKELDRKSRERPSHDETEESLNSPLPLQQKSSMEFVKGFAKRISGYFSFDLGKWFGSDIPELSENFKKSLNELQEVTEKLSKKLKEKSINDNEWLDNLVSQELIDHQQLAFQTIELLARETTTTTTTTTSVILKNLIDGSFFMKPN